MAGLLLRPAVAVSIPFTNCLDDDYVYTNPGNNGLQWVPLRVDASLTTRDATRTLEVIMWGNVTGSWNGQQLPPPGSPDWTNPNATTGKILDDPGSDRPRLTTLHKSMDFLTYEPFQEDSGFCNTSNSLVNATCPLGPVHGTLDLLQPYNLPSVNLTHNFYSSYAFASLSAKFIIIYGDSAATDIGCMSATMTPDLGGLAWMIRYLPLLVLVLVGVATVFAAIYSPSGTSDIFLWTSNYGRDSELLRLVTPGFADCLQYIQFVVLTGSLTLSYPGFYQPVVSQASWSVLMFNQSLVSDGAGFVSVRDGIYVTNGTYGLEKLAHLVGMDAVSDIWAGMMVWLLVIIGAALMVAGGAFVTQALYRSLNSVHEEDLRAKNVPFMCGNMVRITLNYFLMPLVALSMFQLLVASQSPAYAVALAALTIVLVVCYAAWLFRLIMTTKPRAVLFDDLSTVLLHGPLYNTYRDEAAAFALVPFLCTLLRGFAIGAVEPVGIVQLVLLAICEVIQILTLFAFRPFPPTTSMNVYQTFFSAIRLATVLLMVAFVPSLDVPEGPKGWIGYSILVCHAFVLVFGFFLNALQTMLEVILRMAGLGGDDVDGQTRGGLSRIFGMRQLSRRMPRREKGPSRLSQLSSSAMLDGDPKTGYIMPTGRLRSESAGSMGVLVHHRHRSSSAIDNVSIDAGTRPVEPGIVSYSSSTPGAASEFSLQPSSLARLPSVGPGAGPYYRPPRQRRETTEISASPSERQTASWGSGDFASQNRPGAVGGSANNRVDGERSGSRRGPSSPLGALATPAVPFAPRTDYSTREVDFYYGVRGERLNSDAPSRKLGTGPADPTGPMASAAGWLRGLLGGKRKEKGKGFEVVRSSRMPPAMQASGGDFGDDVLPQGIPVAMGRLRNGPIDSDDEEDGSQNLARGPVAADPLQKSSQAQKTELLTIDRSPRDDDEDESANALCASAQGNGGNDSQFLGPVQSTASRRSPLAEAQTGDPSPSPSVPRRSCNRHPQNLPNLSESVHLPIAGDHLDFAVPGSFTRASSRLPFERPNSQRRLSGSSMGLSDEYSPEGLDDMLKGVRPTNYRFVHQGSVSRVDCAEDFLSSAAEVVIDEK